MAGVGLPGAGVELPLTAGVGFPRAGVGLLSTVGVGLPGAGVGLSDGGVTSPAAGVALTVA